MVKTGYRKAAGYRYRPSEDVTFCHVSENDEVRIMTVREARTHWKEECSTFPPGCGMKNPGDGAVGNTGRLP